MGDTRRVILFVDQALSFGGSLVVLGDLVGSLDSSRFKPVVVTEVSDELINHHIADDVVKLRINHIINYQERENIKAVISNNNLLPGFVKKVLLALLSFLDLSLNSIYLFRLAFVMKRHSVDIVHVNNGFGNTEAILASKLTGAKVLVHFHGIGRVSRLSNKLIPGISQFIAISDFVKKSVSNEGVPGKKIEVIHNPVVVHEVTTNQITQLKAHYGIKKEDRIFGIVGRVIPWKGQLEFVKASIHVLKKCPNAKAMIVGDKSDGSIDYYNRIKDLVKKEGIEDRFILTGYIQDIRPIYEVLDVLVHASIEPEPFGLVITEALSHATPVVCSDLGATKELIRDGVDGFIVDPYDDHLLANRIIQLLQNDNERKSMGEAGRSRMIDEFSINSFAHGFESVYERIIENR